MSKNFLVAILLLVFYDLLPHVAHSQPGFISLDCGLPENTSYTESTTEISYVSDVAFVNGGESKSISLEYRVNLQQQGITVQRSFPKGIRNCYKISTRKGTKYLIRAD